MLARLGNAFNSTALEDWQGLPWDTVPLLPYPPAVSTATPVPYGTNMQVAGDPDGCGCAGSCGGCGGDVDSSLAGLPWWVWIGGAAVGGYFLVKRK